MARLFHRFNALRPISTPACPTVTEQAIHSTKQNGGHCARRFPVRFRTINDRLPPQSPDRKFAHYDLHPQQELQPPFV